ncbi:MAG: glycine cleavage system transcriptional repressor [Actinomycetota bacterium]|jgi:glycine cleavage system transcriptional repressor|nr:glycine cleavage system transcriptional repressor [Actinomycetota bacterium]
MSNLVAVTVVGADRPGIVAAITKVLFESGCNLEDVSSTILRGHFSMMLVVETPPEVDPAALEAQLENAGSELGLIVTVRHVEEAASEVTPPTHMVSVYGADKPGIVLKVAEALASAGANITDLTSRVIGESAAPVYAVMLEVVFPSGTDPDAVLSLRDELDVDVSVHPVDSDVL